MTPAKKILGIAHEHDAGVALVGEQGFIYAANEERFNREKFTHVFPCASLKELVSETRCTPDDLACIAIGGKTHISEGINDWWEGQRAVKWLFEFIAIFKLERFLFGTKTGSWLSQRFLRFFTGFGRSWSIKRVLAEVGLQNVPIRYYDHHEAHAASAYAGSGFKRCVVLTLDGQGDGHCSAIYTTDGLSFVRKQTIPFFHSPGSYYQYITLLLGFKQGREGKVTGLAAYGDPETTANIFRSRFEYVTGKLTFRNKGSYRDAEMNYLKKAIAGFSREDVAAGVQKFLEEVVTAYVAEAMDRFGQAVDGQLVLAGGVFANVKLNQRIAELPQVRHLFIYPHMGDGGLAGGAAMAGALEHGYVPKGVSQLYLGTKIEDQAAETALKQHDLVYDQPTDVAAACAERLAKGQVVAVVRDRMEYGPRALGNRSILYAATDPTVNDWLNKRLNRSEFMPFAPIMLERDLPQYFLNFASSHQALFYMTTTLHATELCKKEAPAIVHVDGTARPQIVTESSNPFIYRVLEEYHRRSGLRILVNTSFNMHEEPIVRSCDDAIRAFLQGKIDVLCLGSYLIDHPDLLPRS